MGWIANIRGWARLVKRDVLVVWLAARDPRVPWPAKLVAGLVAAYALSPIDLIPDFIPVLGYLDDLVLVPLGVLLAIRLIPPELLGDLREEAARLAVRPLSRTGAVVMVAIWVFASAGLLYAFWPRGAG